MIAFSVEKLKAMGQYNKNKGITIIAGAKKTLPEGIKPGKDVILVGDCVRKYRDQGIFAGGCPPLEPFPLWAIIDREDHTEMKPDFRPRMAADGKYWESYQKKLEKKRREEIRRDKEI